MRRRQPMPVLKTAVAATRPSSPAAQNVIAQACRCRVDQAFEALIDAAQHYHLSALQLARGLLQLVGDLSRRPEEFHGPAAVAFQQWGQRLVHTNQLHPETPDNKPRQRGTAKTVG